MRTFLSLVILLCLITLFSPYAVKNAYAKPPEDWTAYRIARAEVEGKSSEAQIEIWTEYLATHPESPYRDRVLDEIETLTQTRWQTDPKEEVNYAEEAANVLGGDLEGEEKLVNTQDETIILTENSTQKPVDALNTQQPVDETPRYRKKTFTAAFLSAGVTLGGFGIGANVVSNAVEQDEPGGVLLGSVIVAAALGVGPSLGHLYAGDRQHARRWSTARLFVGGTTGAIYLLGAGGYIEADSAAAGTLIGMIALGGLVAGDLIDSFFVVNRERKKYRAKNYSLLPSFSKTAKGGSQVGLQLVGSF